MKLKTVSIFKMIAKVSCSTTQSRGVQHVVPNPHVVPDTDHSKTGQRSNKKMNTEM